MYGKGIKVSLFQLFLHEIYSEARKRTVNGVEPLAARTHLTEAIEAQQKPLASGATLTVVAALLINGLTEGTNISIRTALGSIDFPAIYVAFFGSIGWFVLISSCLQITALMAAQSRLDTSKIFFAGRPSAYSVLTGGKNYDFLSPIRVGNFFSIRGGTVFGYLLYIPFALLAFPIIGGIATILKFLLRAISSGDNVFLGFGFEAAALCLIILPTLYAFAFFVPLKVNKEVSFIRWSFLYRVTRTTSLHHNSPRWLQDKNR